MGGSLHYIDVWFYISLYRWGLLWRGLWSRALSRPRWWGAHWKYFLSSSLFFYHHHYSLSGPKLLSKNYYHHYLLSKPRWWGVYWREEKITVQVSEKTSIQLWNPQIRGCQFQFSMTRCWVSPLSFEETNRKTITQTKTGKRPKTMTKLKATMSLSISIYHDSLMSKPSRFQKVSSLIYKHFLGIWRWEVVNLRLQDINTCAWLMF